MKGVTVRSYPFSAVVGMDDMALALNLCAVSPAIGGVLVRGEKGTAKSTTVRALTALLPPVEVVADCRFSCDPAAVDPHCPDGPHPASPPTRTRPARLVELPVGAAEDRVLGSLHLERALSEGVTAYDPGLLAAAHRGLLYVDEVNLLHDHLVDVLLDAAAMGRATVEREGVSVTHAARFVLVGTMNPEEGELRPQLLDRFGLTVEVAASRDPQVRAEVMRRRLAYEADPDGFAARYADADAALGAQVAHARKLLPAVRLDDAMVTRIAALCAAADVDGMRADLVIARTAIAHAAWCGRTEVAVGDVRVAARLALPHRRRRNPFDPPEQDTADLDRALNDAGLDEPEDDPNPPTDGPPDPDGRADPDGPPEPPDGGGPGNPAESGRDDERPYWQRPDAPPATETGGDQSRTTPVPAAAPYRARLLQVTGTGAGVAGRRSPALTTSGRTVGARRPAGAATGRPHLVATLRAAAPHQQARGRRGPGILVRPDDVRLPVRHGRESNLILFCLDASGSMGARQRVAAVKAAVLSLLLDAYQRRDKVGLVTFRAAAAEVALPPTASVEVAAARLATLPTGGRTPLAEGLLRAREVLRVERIRDPRRRPLLVVVTDGRATAGPNAVARAQHAARLLAADGTPAVVVDCEQGRVRMRLAGDLAVTLSGEHLPLESVAADTLTHAVRSHTATRHRREAA